MEVRTGKQYCFRIGGQHFLHKNIIVLYRLHIICFNHDIYAQILTVVINNGIILLFRIHLI